MKKFEINDLRSSMILNKIYKNIFLAFVMGLLLSACATQKKVSKQMQGDVYTGTDTVEYLADGVPDRVFFATNESVLTTASRDTLRKQADSPPSGWTSDPKKQGQYFYSPSDLIRFMESPFASWMDRFSAECVGPSPEKDSPDPLMDVLAEKGIEHEKKLELEFNTRTDKDHYEVTPYSYSPKLGFKYSPEIHTDFGQGILQMLDTISNELNSCKK